MLQAIFRQQGGSGVLKGLCGQELALPAQLVHAPGGALSVH
jgi:hypothetical protein